MEDHMTIQLKKRHAIVRWGAFLAVGLGFMLGCATTDTPPEWKPLKTSVEALYLNYHELKTLHGDLHAAALAHIEADGPELSKIQSAARFIQQANLIAFYQWELLSITHYIRASARRDFYTLRERDLLDARDKSNDLIMAVKVYDAFVRDPKASELIAACIQRIEQHIELYVQMAGELRVLNGRALSGEDGPHEAMDA
jgi:hypothetical protein